MTLNPYHKGLDDIPLAVDLRHAMRITEAVAALNCAVVSGRSALPSGLALLNAIEALQGDLRAVLEAERGREEAG